MPPKEESLFFYSRILAALENAKANGKEMLSIAFPELPESAFKNLALAKEDKLLFFFENKKKRLAEAAFEGTLKTTFYKETSFKNLEKKLPQNRSQLSFFKTNDPVPAPKIFIVGTFEDNTKTIATIPVWQVTRSREKTLLCAHFFLNNVTESVVKTILDDYHCLKENADMPQKIESKTSIRTTEKEVGNRWYLLSAAARCISEIESGKYQKIVLARAKDFYFPQNEIIATNTLLSTLRKRFLQKNCTVFFARTNEEHDDEKIIGATPEMLIHIKGRTLETEALAGTIPNLGNNKETLIQSLFNDEKERREHKIVVDFITNKLRLLGITPQFNEVPKILRLPNVFHLHTPISAMMPPTVSAGTLVCKLHPTPAMCGIPVEKTKVKILFEEPFPRENFSAPLGFIDTNGNAFFAIAIRCAKISKTKIRLYAASGLVKGSVPQKEFDEIDSKISALSSILTSS